MAASPIGSRSISTGSKSEIFENQDPSPWLEHVHGILVPGGFGERGAEGKIAAARFARERKMPYFGICFGMQMAVIEAARSLAGIESAGSTEFGPTPEPVVGLMTEWLRGNELEKRAARRRPRRHHAARRLSGVVEARLANRAKSMARPIFPSATATATKSTWPIATGWREQGLIFSGTSPDGLLPETVELADHPWFIGVQYHPELKSRPFEPHPLFASFIEAAKAQSRLV